MRTRKPKIYGEYCEHGYKVFVNGQEVYRAGNHAKESTSHAPLKSHYAVPLYTMKILCITTCREIAWEHKGTYLQVERIEAENY